MILGFFPSSDLGPGTYLICLTVVIVTTQECSILRDLIFKRTDELIVVPHQKDLKYEDAGDYRYQFRAWIDRPVN